MTARGERRLGGFRILSPIKDGKGSQGSVYRAVCERETVPGIAVGEIVALKAMIVRDEGVERFVRIKKRTDLLAGIDHANVVRYRGCFVENDPFNPVVVVVMELLEGQTLKERLEENPGGLDADEAIRIADGALAGLEAAAAAGLVHRDIKPANIFICANGAVKLIDFEISRKEGGTVSTASGRFAGTFDYMAPEFADPGFRGDARSDVFSMGVVLHEALTGDVPYARAKEKGEQADFAFLSRWSQRQEGLCAVHVRSSVRRLLSHADVVLRKALAEDPAERYATAAEFRAGLKTIRFRELCSGNRSYRLLRLIGRGGFGEVFKARIRGTGEYVAVKHLLKAAYGDRFKREARVMRQLDDPAFVRFVDYFETQHAGGEEAFLVMAYLPGMPGMSLRDAIKRRTTDAPLPASEVLKAFVRYARGLVTMHRRGIFHRDIKPSNLYYPVGNPAAAAIMDLGIARDVNGTATFGQVPGTLDYMSPEVVVGGSRGDAGMDIYALGLCLYEALSGKTAYPRLPTGPTAFAAFYERARARLQPTFDSPAVQFNPQLLSLLGDMTAIDPARRIQDADALCRRLETVALSCTGAPSLRKEEPPTRPQHEPRTVGTTPSSVRPSHSSRSVQTRQPPHPAYRPPPTPPRDYGRLVRPALKVLAALTVVGGLGIGVRLVWNPVREKIASLQTERDRKAQENIRREMERRQEEAARAEAQRTDGVRRTALGKAAEVVRKFDDRGGSVLAAENAAGEWVLEWRANADVKDIFAVQTNRFAVAKAERLARDKREENEARVAKARRESNDFIEACRGRQNSTDWCKTREKELLGAWKNELDEASYRELEGLVARAFEKRELRDKEEAKAAEDAKRRQNVLEKAEQDARARAGKIAARFADENVALTAVKAEYAVWQSEWGKFRDMSFFTEATAVIDAAIAERELVESGRAVAAECGKWLDNIASTSASNVKNWRGNIDRAELELKNALLARRISQKAADVVRRRIDACRTWSVGVIDNKTHRTVEFCGRSIPPISCGTFVFTNGVPEGAAVTSEGCDPFRVKEDGFDSEVVVVMRLEERKGGAQARIPPLGDDVSCLVDGVERHPGTVELRQGRHRVVYRRRKETYPGVRDFCDQETAFSTSPAGVVDVPPPSSDWKPSQEFEAAKANAGLVARGREIVAQCESNLAPEPLETRRSRLGRAFGILNDWQTASALSILGEGVERDLRAKYEAERRRIRGYVRNATALPLTVMTDTKPVTVPPGTRAVVTFEREWRGGDAYASVPGYEFVMLPRSADDFDGKEFVVSQERLVGVPVKVSLPPLEDGVVCGVQGRRVEGSVNLRPGEYEGEYRKPDCARQKFRFTVKVGESLTLPPPGKWEPSGAMSLFAEAMSSFASGAVDDAKAITERIGTIEDPAKRRELEDLKRAIEIREKLEGKSK